MATIPRLYIGAGLQKTPSTTIAFQTFILDATTDAVEWIIQADEATTITQVAVPVGLRAGTPPTYRASIQGVNTSGNPDGTIKGGGSPASKTFTPPASTAWDNTTQWIVLDNSYTCTRGEFLALVIDYSAGSVAAGNSITIRDTFNTAGNRTAFPYAIENNATVRARSTAFPCYGYRSSTQSYGTAGTSVATGATFNSNSNPNERGMAFTLPLGAGATYQVMGARINIVSPAAAKTFDVRLYSGTTIIQTVTFDSDAIRSAGQNANTAEFLFQDTTLATLNFGTEYYLVLAPNETTTAIGLTVMTFTSAQDATGAGGNGYFYYATRNGGAWTLDTVQVPFIELLLSDLTAVQPSFQPLMRQNQAVNRASTY